MERFNLPTGGVEVVIGKNKTTLKKKPVAIVARTRNQTHEALSVGAKPSRLPKARTTTVTHTRAANDNNKRGAKILSFTAKAILGALFVVGVGNLSLFSKIDFLETTEHGQVQEKQNFDHLLTAHNNIQELRLPANVETYSGHEVNSLPPALGEGKWRLHVVERGDTLESVLDTLQLVKSGQALLNNPSIAENLGEIKDGQKLLFQVEEEQIQQVIYGTTKQQAYIITRDEAQDAKHAFVGKWDNELFEASQTQLAFTIKKPFHYEAEEAGLPSSITHQISSIFKPDINFRKIQIGDQVSVIFEEYFYQSERIYTDKIVAAEFNHRDNPIQRIRFTRLNGKSYYLRTDGDHALKQVAFSRRPIRGGRLSSGYGMRRHPVLKRRRMHSGTDFAAPRGTPILATGDGTVSFVGRKGAYGRTIILKHADKITTLYGHMSRYKKNLRPGAKVSRGDVIGYVGSSGRSTGNHVHYEFRVRGKAKNPMKVALPQKGILSPNEVKVFKKLAKHMEIRLNKLRTTANLDRIAGKEFGG